MTTDRCPFCNLDPNRTWLHNAAGIALADAFPVTPGHTLVVPRCHVPSLFDLDQLEQALLWELVGAVRLQLLKNLQPDAFTIGLNDGTAAGQTVGHAHIHVIPRRTGDVADPRGGLRWVIPDKARYWKD